MFKRYGIIYLITCAVNGKIYVGQTVQSLRVRHRSHFNTAFHPGKKDTYFNRALRKYGKESFTISVICSCYNKEELDLMEDIYIAAYDSMNSSIGYNARRGGANGKFSEESKKRCSISKTGRRHSEETRRKMGEVQKGRTGFHPSEATRKKMRERTGNKSSNYRKDISTEEIIRLYQEGLGTPEIGRIMSIDGSTAWDRLRKAGVPLRPPGKGKGESNPVFKKEVLSSELARLYEEGFNTKQLGKMFPLTPGSITKRLKNFGIQMRPRFFRATTSAPG